jgi:hypothetical protein
LALDRFGCGDEHLGSDPISLELLLLILLDRMDLGQHFVERGLVLLGRCPLLFGAVREMQPDNAPGHHTEANADFGFRGQASV